MANFTIDSWHVGYGAVQSAAQSAPTGDIALPLLGYALILLVAGWLAYKALSPKREKGGAISG